MNNTEVQILIGLFTCHWLADYTHLSTSWMLNAKRLGTPFIPILSHAAVHGLLMTIFLSFYTDNITLLKMFLLQTGSHFVIDVWKGKMNKWFPTIQSPANKIHWVIFGLDQLLHAIVIIIMSLYI